MFNGKKRSFELVKREVTKEDGISYIILFTSETIDDTTYKYIATILSILARRTFFEPCMDPRRQVEYIILKGKIDEGQTLGETDVTVRCSTLARTKN